MGARATAADVKLLADTLATYHADHAFRYGSMQQCTDTTCVEGRWALAWLTPTCPSTQPMCECVQDEWKSTLDIKQEG